MTEQRVQDTKFQAKWVMCPTCRQHTDFENIAYADDGQNETCSSSVGHTNQGHAKCEESMIVHGSYGTKVCFLLMPYHKLVRYWCHSNFILVIRRLKRSQEESCGSSIQIQKPKFLFSQVGMMSLMYWNMPSLLMTSLISGWKEAGERSFRQLIMEFTCRF